jgi:probable HAF family extracellular repeat protein
MRDLVRTVAGYGATLALLFVPACEDEATAGVGSGGASGLSGGRSASSGGADAAVGGASSAGASHGDAGAYTGTGGRRPPPPPPDAGSGGQDADPPSTGGMTALPVGDPACDPSRACRHGGSCLDTDWSVCTCPSEAVPDCEGVRFRALGFLPDARTTELSDLTADGSVVVASSGVESQWFRAVSWALEDGLRVIPELSDTSSVSGISGDGSLVVGNGIYGGVDRPFRLQNGVLDHLGLDTSGSIDANDVSSDGSIIVGSRSDGRIFHAFRWTEEGGVMDLGELEAEEHSVASATNVDGSVVVGLIGVPPSYDAFRWDEDSGLQRLELPPGGSNVQNITVSADGRWIALDAVRDGEAVLFSWSDGELTELPRIPGNEGHQVFGISGDGSAIVGRSGPATIWRRGQPLRLVRELLEEDGVDLSAWELEGAQAISDDGRVLIGSGFCRNRAQAWIAWLD